MKTLYVYGEVSHTADKATKVVANSLAGLLIGATHGMYATMGEPSAVGEERVHFISLFGVFDPETLLVSFLNEVLAIAEDEGGAPTEVIVEESSSFDTVAGGHFVEALVSFHEFVPDGAGVKAATFHDIQILEADGLLEVVVVLDV